MGLTKDYQRITCAGVCNVVNSTNGMIQAVDKVICAASACESINFYNLRTGEMANSIRRDNHQVTAFKFSPNKRFLAIGYDDGEIHLYDRKNDDNDKPVIFDGHKRGINTLAFSHDGFTLASGGKDSLIILWDVLNESGKYRLNGHTDSITQLQFTVDNKYLVSSSKDTSIRFWDVSSHSCFYTISESISEIYGFALIKNDQLLVVGSAEVELIVYELNWLNQIKEDDEELENSNEKNNQTKKRKLLSEPLVGSDLIEEDSDQGNTIIRSKRRGRLIRQAKGRALQLAVSPDEAVICVLGGDVIMDIFRVYDNDEAKKRLAKKLRKAKRKLETKDDNEEEEKITEAEISKDVTIFISRIGEFRSESKLKWIDYTGEFSKKDENGRQYRIYGMQSNNTLHGITVAVDFKTNEVQSESLANLNKRGHRSDVRCFAVAENNRTFVSGSADSGIIWDLNSLLPINRFEADEMKDLISAFYVPGDKYVIFGSKDGTLFIFDLATCDLINEYKKAHDGGIWSIVGFPNKSGFVTVGSDKKAHFWEYQMVTEIGNARILKLNQIRSTELEDEILCATISPNGRFIIFGLLNFTARVHYLDSLKFFLSLYGHSLPVMCLDVDIESKLVVTGSSDKGCKIWGLDFGDCHKSLYGHSDAVTAVKFNKSTEEKLFFSAGKDGKIIQWDAIKFNKIQILDGHFAEIRDMIFTYDGRTLISASHDKSIRIWEETDELVVLSEQEAAEIEKDYLEKMIDAEDIIPGEGKDSEAELATKKSVETIKSTETILEAIEIIRTEKREKESNSKHSDHPLIVAYGSTSHEHFILDAIHRIRPAHLERSLLMVPFGYVPEIIKSLTKCIEDHYRIELSTRILLFLFKIHHNYISRSINLFPLIDDLRLRIPAEIEEVRDKISFNSAALKLLKLQLEDRDNVKIFKDVSQINGKGKKSKKKPGERAALVRAKV
uniref:Small-subunit processome Utp12 domain-containing protein n=1 Tax=Panagrolaimus sp. PS1159 TaxID=55785 RepID=A0AC35GW59_9BILA